MTKIVAIDGPAGSGKSSVAKALAKALGFLHVDTGAIYRSVAYEALQQDVSLDDEQALAKIALGLQEINPSPEIRSEQVSQAASKVSQYPAVRTNLLELQRRFGRASKTGAVLEGRDIGTVVFPDAEYKFFVTASAEERAKRRFLELESKSIKTTYEDVLKEQDERDKRDETRSVSPLIPAQDAVLVDTTGMSLDEVVRKIKQMVIGS
ncbi:MAG: (d)CMP kinase [Deltaproteobacteria bacterium]|nr:(d)CMP kinase [Deltaproteobacteria bacterium]